MIIIFYKIKLSTNEKIKESDETFEVLKLEKGESLVLSNSLSFIRTSSVFLILKSEDYIIVKTKNSAYVLEKVKLK